MENIEIRKILGCLSIPDVTLIAVWLNFIDMIYTLIIFERHLNVDPAIELVLAVQFGLSSSRIVLIYDLVSTLIVLIFIL